MQQYRINVVPGLNWCTHVYIALGHKLFMLFVPTLIICEQSKNVYQEPVALTSSHGKT